MHAPLGRHNEALPSPLNSNLERELSRLIVSRSRRRRSDSDPVAALPPPGVPPPPNTPRSIHAVAAYKDPPASQPPHYPTAAKTSHGPLGRRGGRHPVDPPVGSRRPFAFIDEILVQVLQFLTPKELCTACHVSSRWLEATLAVPLLNQRRQWWQGDRSMALERAPLFPAGPPLRDASSVHVLGVPPIPCDDSLDLPTALRTNLQRLGWLAPSTVQRHLIPAFLARRDVMAMAQHLSGKTAGCMIGMIAVLLQPEHVGARMQRGRQGAMRTQPSGLVVVPSRAAAIQAAIYCRWLAQRSPIVTASCYSEAARGPQLMQLGQSVVDVLVATPRRLRLLLQANVVTLEHVVVVVLDSVDELVDQALEATEFLVQMLPLKRISCANANQDLSAQTNPRRVPVMNFLTTSKFLDDEIVIFHDGFSPPPVATCPRWKTVDANYD